ncbi:MAG: hypothetical protein KGH61_02205 [Candidatus Micrarchaeota archaeon]|nr:hypothetical protein [Candidatus Micrarchaeota archaeon]MDE1847741.1 hypothetical protein [Candidatus Micrarchaeota archaeon]MDE1863884.1 hypothetical protein [Candidatus Micrarchaeota archaeon]
MARSYCIICGDEKNGLPVQNDMVLDAIRWFKQNVTKNEKGNRLIVCKECFPRYADRRKKFENRQATYLAIGIIFAALGLIFSFSLTTLAVAILLIVFLYLLSLLNYVPKVALPSHKTSK